MRPLLGWADWSDLATITGSTAQSGAPLTSLQKKQPKQVWASANVSSPVYMELDRGASYSWNAVALLFANVSRQAVWRVRAAANQASLTSSPSYDFGGALSLDGSTQYAEQSFTSTGSISAYTVGLRVRAETIRQQGILQLLGTKFCVIRMTASGDIECAFTTGTTLVPGYSLGPKRWTHVVVTVSGSTAIMYYSGVEVARQTDAVPGNFSSITAASSYTNRLYGMVDDVQFWTRALTAAEVLADFERGGNLETPQTGLHTYCSLDGTNANAGSVGGTLSYTGSPTYVAGARFTASPWDHRSGSELRHSLLWVPAGVTNRWLRIDIDDPLNADLTIEAGRLVVGNAWQFRQLYPGSLPSFEDSSQIEVLPGGQSAVNAYTPVPVASVNVKAETEREMMENLHEIARRRGASKDVLYVRDPDPANVYREHGMLYGVLQAAVPISLPEYGRYEAKLDIHGLL